MLPQLRGWILLGAGGDRAGTPLCRPTLHRPHETASPGRSLGRSPVGKRSVPYLPRNLSTIWSVSPSV